MPHSYLAEGKFATSRLRVNHRAEPGMGSVTVAMIS